jgi:hypothetical protein
LTAVKRSDRIAKDILTRRTLYRVKRASGRDIVMMDLAYDEGWLASCNASTAWLAQPFGYNRSMGCALRVLVSLVLLAPLAAHADDESYESRLNAMDRAVSAGDAWNEGVPKLVKVLGQPAVVKPKEIKWAFVLGAYCTTVDAKLDADGFIEILLPVPYGAAAPPKDFAACKKLATKHAKLGKLPPPRKVNIEAAVNTVISQWRDGKLQALSAAAHPDLQKAVPLSTYEQLAKVFATNAGKLVKVGKPVYSVGNFSWIATVPFTYEKHAVEAVLAFRIVKGTPKLYGFNQGLLDDMEPMALVKDAPKAARAFLDLLVAGKLADAASVMHWDIATKFRANKVVAGQLKEILGKYGKLTKVVQGDVDGRGGAFTVAFDVVGANGTGQARVDLLRMVGQWMVTDFNIVPPQK